MEKPDVDLIDGLSPAISIEQKTTASNPRSTVGTVTEIYDYLRLLFANIGIPHCHQCGREISAQSLERIMDMVMLYPQDARINVLAPIVRGRKGEFKKELAELKKKGFSKARIDGVFRSLDEDIKLDRRRNHAIDIVVDRLIVKSGIERRLAESIEMALTLADDIVVINTLEGGDRLFSRKLACIECGISMPEMTPRAFSFNSPHGACTECQGLGAMHDFDPNRIVPDQTKSLVDGAIVPWAKGDRKLVRDAIAGLGEKSRIRSRHAVRQPAEESARSDSLRRQRQRLRGHHPESAPPVRRSDMDRAGRPRRVSLAAAVPGVPRRAAEAAEPRGEGEGPDDVRLREPADQRGVRRLQRAGVERAREPHRRDACSRKFRIGCDSSTTSASATSRSAAARRRCREARGSASGWPRRLART